MATATRTQRRYDHRLRNLVRTTRDIHCAIQRGVPRSTARGWLTDSEVPVVTVEALNLDATQLQREVLRLRRRVQKMIALLRVFLVVWRMSGYSLSQTRLPSVSSLTICTVLTIVLCAKIFGTFGASSRHSDGYSPRSR
ncbi:hypothetical protein ETAA8_58050 [Anatilimnocola aggregata]|uniref:Uncharacterized protein n=1 Tax=Anatilimnocola aggregata TaxID=2528021 RepID=A0A517YKA2_9BACT|nr:hypothetical protein ETAA8_58050 [Anatilimnocola aggregata]